MKLRFLLVFVVVKLIFIVNVWGFVAPEAKITLKVVDERGKPLEGIGASISFDVPHPDKQGLKSVGSKGFTDSQGMFTVQSRSLYDVAFSAKKNGYYKSWGSYQFKKIKSGRLEPWNPTVELVMKKIEKPIAMYAREVIIDIPATSKEVGFDLIELDWVAPNGKGKKADFIFKLDGIVKSWKEYEGTLHLAFSNKFDGIQLIKEDRNYGSELKLLRFAPEKGYDKRLKKYNRRLSNSPFEEDYEKDNNYIFRIRSEEEDGKLVKALYGKIHGDIRFDPREGKAGAISFKYYLNPDYTRNLEFDPKRNLFKNLKSFERVGLN